MQNYSKNKLKSGFAQRIITRLMITKWPCVYSNEGFSRLGDDRLLEKEYAKDVLELKKVIGKHNV